MRLLDYFRSDRRNSAAVAKERLQIIIAHESDSRHKGPTYLPELQRELLEVVRKYVAIDKDQIKVNVDKEGDYEVLELNITLPDSQQSSS